MEIEYFIQPDEDVWPQVRLSVFLKCNCSVA